LEPSLSLRFTALVTPDLVRQATAGIFWRQALQWRLGAGLGGILLLGQLLMASALPQAGWALHGLLALLFVFSAAAVAVLASRYYQGLAVRNFERFKDAPLQVELDEEAYRYSASWGRGSIEWGRFDSLWRFPAVWVLLQHLAGGASVVLPLKDLGPEAQAFILRKLGQAGAKVLA
jgi:hypothetical protein